MLKWFVQASGVAAAVLHASSVYAQAQGPVLKPGAAQNFQTCDGYGAPNGNGDGITKAASGFLGIFIPEPKSGDTGLRGMTVSAFGIEACTDALANTERLLPQYHIRRASLLRARAIHRFGTNDKRGAQADLDAADAEGAIESDRFYLRSMGLGNQLLRAYFVLSEGQAERAATLTRETAKARPYSGAIQRLANVMLFNAERNPDARYAALDADATLNPNMRRVLLEAAADRLDWAKVIETRAQLDFTPPKQHQAGFLMEDYPLVLARLFVDRFRFDTLTSFALAAQGRDADSRALLDALAQRLEPLKADLPLQPNGSKQPRVQRDAHRYLQAYHYELKQQLAAARADATLMELARRGDTQGFLKEAERRSVPHNGRGLAMLRALREAKASNAALDALEATLTEAKARHDRDPIPLTVDQLYRIAPTPETRGRIPKYASSKALLGDSGNGFFLDMDGVVQLVSFEGMNASEAVVEELALLKAAEEALAAGKDRFALLDKDAVGRSSMYGYMGFGRPIASGYIVNLRVIRFGPEGPPPGYEAFATRAIAAREVIDALAPVYEVETANAKP
nr:hypothetical protein [uncultured Sphingomonas sp.]